VHSRITFYVYAKIGQVNGGRPPPTEFATASISRRHCEMTVGVCLSVRPSVRLSVCRMSLSITRKRQRSPMKYDGRGSPSHG